jgi:hypothetical protein
MNECDWASKWATKVSFVSRKGQFLRLRWIHHDDPRRRVLSADRFNAARQTLNLGFCDHARSPAASRPNSAHPALSPIPGLWLHRSSSIERT